MTIHDQSGATLLDQVDEVIYSQGVLVVGDDNFDLVELLLNADNQNDAATPVLDTSQNPKTITSNGVFAVTTANPYAGGGAVRGNGTTSYGSIPYAPWMVLNNVDFTIEGALYVRTLPAEMGAVIAKDSLLSSRFASWGMYIKSDGSLVAATGRGSSNANDYVEATLGTVTLNQYHYFSWSRTGGNDYLAFDGASTSRTQTLIRDGGQALGILSDTDAQRTLNADLDMLRVTVGLGRYTGNYAPPTESHPETGPTTQNQPPRINDQPDDVTVGNGQTATFTVVASDPDGDPITYQWYDASDDSPLAGETSPVLSFEAMLEASGDQFYCIVDDGQG